MYILNKINSWMQQFATGIRDKYKRHISAKIMIDLATYGPIALTGIYLTNANTKKIINSVISEDIQNFIAEHSFPIFIFFILLNYISQSIIPIFFRNLDDPTKNITLKQIMSLLEARDLIEKYRSSRIDGKRKKLLSKKIKSLPHHEFTDILEPEQQIYYAVNALQQFLQKLLNNNTDVSVRLIEVSGKKAVSWFVYAPGHNPPRSSVSDLEHPEKTCIEQCIKRHSLIVIPDLKKETSASFSKYKGSDLGKNSVAGSLICYPIHDAVTRKWPFVLSIKMSKANHNIDKRKDLYEWLIDQFSQVIQVEYGLIQLKNMVEKHE